MIEIDGSEGGGAIVRVAVGLSVATRQPVRIRNIREKRPNPGLQPQHLASVRAAATLTDAELVGAEQGSAVLTFVPNSPRFAETVRVTIPTAGSVALALQPLQIGLLNAVEALDIVVDGGATAGKWAPPVDYLQHVTLPVLKQAGFYQSLQVKRHGFYPKGGALVHATIGPSSLESVDLTERGDVERFRGISVASEHLREAEVAERQRTEARRVLANADPSPELDIETRYVDARSPGSVITLWAETVDGHVIGADALGEKGKRAELVGKDAAESLLEQLDTGAPVDEWMADQILPILGIAGGRVRVPRFTGHVGTNIRIVKRFVDGFAVDREKKVVEARGVT